MSGSLRRRLMISALACIACVMLPLLALSYAKIVEEVNELSDARLSQSAKTLEALVFHVANMSSTPSSAAPLVISNWMRPKGSSEATVAGHGYETQIGFQLWTTPASLRLTTQDLADLGFDAAPVGFADIVKDKRRWRVYTKIGNDGGFIRAAERYDSRREIARDLLIQNTLPLLLGLPLLALLMGFAIRRALAPLAYTADRLETRHPYDTGPLDIHDAPGEVAPLVAALNGLLHRLRDVLEKEREFTANAAHELRTPLAGALIHVENALAARDGTRDEVSLREARAALTRMVRLVNQLLELARWDAASRTHPFERVDLAALIDDEVEALARRAAALDVRIERNFQSSMPPIPGWDAALRILVVNLLDNALRYGPRGATVSIATAVIDDAAVLTICDDGPGIAADQRDAMTRRFRRGAAVQAEGAGLGLSIVKRIAELHNARLELHARDGGPGLCVRVAFPLAS